LAYQIFNIEGRNPMVCFLNRFLLIVAFLIAAIAPAFSQQITGRVLDAQNGRPVFNITVWCEGSGFSGRDITDRNGNFHFAQLVPGHYTVSVHTPGYKDAMESRDLLDPRSSEYLLIRLKEDVAAKPASSPAGAIDANVPAKAREEFDKGVAAIGEGKKEKFQEGVAHLQKAIALYPKYLQAQLMLGTTYMDLQEWDHAEQTLKKAMETDPKAANAMFALGEIYLRQKKDDEAEKILLQALQVEDRSFQGHLILGRVYWDVGSKQKDEAQWRPLLEKSYNQAKLALELNPNLAEAHLLKGNLLLRVGRAQDALIEFEEYLRLDPKGSFVEPTRATTEKIRKALANQKKPSGD
jgi:tetratricopeptide (TPR) repeat protein